MKILRISPETHDAFKDLCKRENKGLTDATEILIQSALKKGTLKEVKQNVFNQIQHLETTFKSWMKKQEKNVLTGISEDLIILSRRFKEVSTKSENEILFESGINKIEQIVTNSIKTYEQKAIQEINKKNQLYRHLKNTSIAIALVLTIYLTISFFIKGAAQNNLTNTEDYENLVEYCRVIEKKHNLDILNSYENWKVNQIFQKDYKD